MKSSSDPALASSETETPVVRPVSSDEGFAAWALPNFDLPVPDAAEAASTSPSPAELEQTRQEAAEAGFAQGRSEGFQAGFSAGQADGLAAAQEETSRMQQRFLGWLHSLAEPLANLDAEVGTQLARLATQIARAMIYRELTLAPEQIDAVARAALNALPVAVHSVVLVCHPDEAAALHAAIDAGGFPARGAGEIQVRVDASLAPGGLRVESATIGIQSVVDATLDTRWAELCLRVLGEQVPGPTEPIRESSPDHSPQNETLRDETPAEGDASRLAAAEPSR